MQIFGLQVNTSYVYVGSGTLGGLGLCYALYKLFKRKSKEKITYIEELAVVEDLKLPELLEHDFGNYLATCQTVDAKASAFLNELPEHFFRFNDTLLQLICAHFAQKRLRRCTRTLVIGSGTGKLVFELDNYCSQVIGVDIFFSRIITCFRFQNDSQVKYDFPLEGTYRTVEKEAVVTKVASADEVDSESLAIKSVDKILKSKLRKESTEFVNADIGSTGLSLHLGQFQVVIITDEINETSDPEVLLRNVHRYVETEGLLIICTDYNWKRTTNQKQGFTKSTIKTSFDFFKFMLRGFFDLVEESNIPDVVGVSLRSCIVRNMHVTVWERNNRPILP
ncbi:unnamed protein product [Allacma fusca]|uniref:Uncharacterized protein n=1 Tax=Allacma fusca TaxID=39272 RepID=A0A8J2LTK0_9HEXA|nr:unnamed protein product [Allacma fusca]